MNCECTFELKQHTPLIHFQANQSGSTIRGTDFGGFFDKFLKEKYNLKNDNFLDYQIRISQNERKKEMIDTYNPFKFRIGEDDKKGFKNNKKCKKCEEKNNCQEKKGQKACIYNTTVIKFISFNKEVLKKIKESFPTFISNHNFGALKNKGFGSFYIKDEKFNTKLIINNSTDVYKFTSSVDLVFNDIALLSNMLRSGINNQGFYAKSLLFLYAYEKLKDTTWEKRKIKKHFFDAQLKKQKKQHSGNCVFTVSDKPYLLRDLLGLSASQNWGRDYQNGNSDDVMIEKKHTNNEIERIPSPIFFKPIINPDHNTKIDIYFWGQKRNDNEILNQEFSIKCTTSQKKPLIIYTPKIFDLNDFLKYAVDKVKTDLNSIVNYDTTNHSHKRHLKKLKKIFIGNNEFAGITVLQNPTKGENHNAK